MIILKTKFSELIINANQRKKYKNLIKTTKKKHRNGLRLAEETRKKPYLTPKPRKKTFPQKAKHEHMEDTL